MSVKHKIQDQTQLHFVTFAVDRMMAVLSKVGRVTNPSYHKKTQVTNHSRQFKGNLVSTYQNVIPIGVGKYHLQLLRETK